MPQALRRVAGALRVSREPLHLFSACRADYLEPDVNPLEICGGVIDVVLFGVAKRGPHVGGGVVDGYLVQWREPRHLSQQSKRSAHHQELERGRALFGAAANQRLVCLDDELAHTPFEVDILDNSRHSARRDSALGRLLRAHLRSKAFDFAHLLL